MGYRDSESADAEVIPMRSHTLWLALAALLLALGAAAQQPTQVARTHLKVGQMAPDFTLPSDQFKPVRLSDFRGKKTVILAFYVLAFTPG